MERLFIVLSTALLFAAHVSLAPALAYPTGPRPTCTAGKRPTVVTQTVKGSNWTCKYNKFSKSYSGTGVDESNALSQAKNLCRAGGAGSSGPSCEVNSFYVCAQQTVEVWACN